MKVDAINNITMIWFLCSLTKAENMIAYKDEIYSRPKRTWIVTEKEKKMVVKASKVKSWKCIVNLGHRYLVFAWSFQQTIYKSRKLHLQST